MIARSIIDSHVAPSVCVCMSARDLTLPRNLRLSLWASGAQFKNQCAQVLSDLLELYLQVYDCGGCCTI
jgi:hypothetical protein